MSIRSLLAASFSLSLLASPAISAEPWYVLTKNGCTPLTIDQWDDKPTTPDEFLSTARSFGSEVKIIKEDDNTVLVKVRFEGNITGLAFFRGETGCQTAQRMLKSSSN